MEASACQATLLDASLNVARSVKRSDGFEALRQLILVLRPSTNKRGLAVTAALTRWPAFQCGVATSGTEAGGCFGRMP